MAIGITKFYQGDSPESGNLFADDPLSTDPRSSIEDAVLNGLKELYQEKLGDINVADVCTGDYYSIVSLTNGSQGAAINFYNVHGPHQRRYDHKYYDDVLLRTAKSDPLLHDTLLMRGPLEPLGQSVKIAIFNALSTPFYSDSSLSERGFSRSDGFLNLNDFVRAGDVVGMIGCLGNYSCWQIGRMSHVSRVLFSDFEYVDEYKAGMDRFIRETFCMPEKVVCSDGSQNREICETSDVVMITAGTLCTNTLDDLLTWSADAREVLVLGWSYGMVPGVVFTRGVTGMTAKMAARENLTDFVRWKLEREGFGYTNTLTSCFQRVHVVKSPTLA